jgi:DNA-binding transcriptional ArsR family regulator
VPDVVRRVGSEENSAIGKVLPGVAAVPFTWNCSTRWLTVDRCPTTLNQMVDHQTAEMDTVFQALANSTRRDMLVRLAECDLTVGELAEPLSMTLAAASKHIKVLERVGLVRQTVAGRRHVCRLEAQPLASASDWLRFYERHWAERLDALDTLFRTETAQPEEDQ